MLIQSRHRTMEQITRFTADDIPRIVKESGFHFTLRRGRLDWKKIDGINVDELVQERDFVTLQQNIINIASYNLESEYDVRVLDSNFVKIFKLAQLSIDYLIYTQEFLSNCIEKVGSQLNAMNEENEKLKIDCKKKDETVKVLKKKIKERDHIKAVTEQFQHACYSLNFLQQHFKCATCGKIFLTAEFLDAHHLRRHVAQVQQKSQQLQPSTQENIDVKTLLFEIHELKQRLSAAEQLLQETKERNIKSDELVDNSEHFMEEKEEEWKKKQEQELTNLRQLLETEIEKYSSTEHAEMKELQNLIHKQEEQIKHLQHLLIVQAENSSKMLEERLCLQEQVWSSRLQELEKQNSRAMEQLKQQQPVASQLPQDNVPDAGLYTYAARLIQLQELSMHQEQQLQEQTHLIDQLKAAPEKNNITAVVDKAPHAAFTNPVAKILVSNGVANSQAESVSSVIEMSTTIHTPYSIQDSADSVLYLQRRIMPCMVQQPTSEDFVGNVQTSVPSESQEEEETYETESETSVTEQSQDVVSDEDIERYGIHTSSEHLKKGIREELQLILDQRLRELGIDPEWTHLPQASLQHNLTTLRHHQKISAKRYSNYFRIRKQLLSDVSNRLRLTKGERLQHSQNNDKKKTYKLETRDKQALQIDDIMSSVKKKAQKVLNRSRSNTIPKSGMRETNRSSKSVTKRIKAVSNNQDTLPMKSYICEDKSSSISLVEQMGKSNKETENFKAPVNQGKLDANFKPVSELFEKLSVSEISEDSSSDTSLTTIIKRSPTDADTMFQKTLLTQSKSSGNLKTMKGLHVSLPNDTQLDISKNMRSEELYTDSEGKSDKSHCEVMHPLSSALKTSSTTANVTKKKVLFQDISSSDSLSNKETSWDSGVEKNKFSQKPETFNSIKEKNMQETWKSEDLELKSNRNVRDIAREIEDNLGLRLTKPAGGLDILPPSSAAISKTINSKKIKENSFPLSEWDLEDVDENL